MALELREDVIDDCHTLTVVGDLDIASAPELEARIRRLCNDGASEIVLDLHELSFMDSTGLRLILTSREECHRRGCEFSLTRVQPPTQHLFELSGAIDWLSMRGRALAHRFSHRRGKPERIAASRRRPDLEVSLPLDLGAPRSARNYVRDLLRDERSRELRDAAQLLTSEIVTSVLLERADPSALGGLRVWLLSGRVRVELTVPRELLAPPPAGETRYDLILLEELADRWSVDAADPIASIWFEVARERGGEAPAR